MMRTVRNGLSLACALAFALPASATYATFFGEDVQNNGPDVPLTSTPGSDGARDLFRARLQAGVGTETFELVPTGNGPVDITMGSITATLSGGDGKIEEVDSGFTSLGRYSIPSASTKRLWTANATATGSSFEIRFGQEVAAFGFNAIDVGDEGANVVIEFLDGAGNVIPALSGLTADMDYTKGIGGSTDGSVFYFGVVAGAGDTLFSGVRFKSTSTFGDGMGFDNFSVALRSELNCTVNCGNPDPLPEPGTVLLVAAAALGLRLMHRRKA